MQALALGAGFSLPFKLKARVCMVFPHPRWVRAWATPGSRGRFLARPHLLNPCHSVEIRPTQAPTSLTDLPLCLSLLSPSPLGSLPGPGPPRTPDRPQQMMAAGPRSWLRDQKTFMEDRCLCFTLKDKED